MVVSSLNDCGAIRSRGSLFVKPRGEEDKQREQQGMDERIGKAQRRRALGFPPLYGAPQPLECIFAERAVAPSVPSVDPRWSPAVRILPGGSASGDSRAIPFAPRVGDSTMGQKHAPGDLSLFHDLECLVHLVQP